MNSLVRTPSPPASTIDHTFPRPSPSFIYCPFTTLVPSGVIVRRSESCDSTHHHCLHRVRMPLRPYSLGSKRWSCLILQDDRIDTVSALHAAEGLDVVSTGVTRIVVPLVYEQASATSARFRVELIARGKRSNDLFTFAFCHRPAPK